MLKGLFLAAAFLVGIFWLDLGTSHHPKYNYAGATNADQQQNAAANPVAEKVVGAPKSNKTSTTKQQEKTGNFVKWVEWFFSDTNRALVIGTFALAAGAFLQFGLTWGTARRQLRAYVFVDSAGIFDTAQVPVRPVNAPACGGPGAFMIIKNFGQTPAYDVVHWSQMDTCKTLQEDTLVTPKKMLPVGALSLGPGGTANKGGWMNRVLTKVEIAEIATGVRAFYVYGKIWYRDAFQRRRITEYRMQYIGKWPPPPEVILGISLKGNRAT